MKIFSVLFLIIFITSCSTFQTYEEQFDKCINKFSTSNNKSLPSSKILVVGHGYGSHEDENTMFAPNFLKYLKNNNKNSNYIGITGDFVRFNTKEYLLEAKNYIENNFQDYFIAPGNHEVINNNNFYEIFGNKTYHKTFDNFELIAANFSNKDWLPSNDDKLKINNIIKNSKKDTVILLSHQIFWFKDVNEEIVPNGYDLLEGEMSTNSLSWLNYDEKNLVVISGDYGAWGDKAYCNDSLTNTIFIAEGLNNSTKDTIISIVETDNGFYLESIKLSE